MVYLFILFTVTININHTWILCVADPRGVFGRSFSTVDLVKAWAPCCYWHSWRIALPRNRVFAKSYPIVTCQNWSHVWLLIPLFNYLDSFLKWTISCKEGPVQRRRYWIFYVCTCLYWNDTCTLMAYPKALLLNCDETPYRNSHHSQQMLFFQFHLLS